MEKFDFSNCKSIQALGMQKATYLTICQSQQEVIALNKAATEAKQHLLLERQKKIIETASYKKVPVIPISSLDRGKQFLHQRVNIVSERGIGVLKIDKDGSVSF